MTKTLLLFIGKKYEILLTLPFMPDRSIKMHPVDAKPNMFDRLRVLFKSFRQIQAKNVAWAARSFFG